MSIGAAAPRIECVEFAVSEIKIRKKMAALTEWNCAAARIIALSRK
jgi:hypothetical protein